MPGRRRGPLDGWKTFLQAPTNIDFHRPTMKRRSSMLDLEEPKLKEAKGGITHIEKQTLLRLGNALNDNGMAISDILKNFADAGYDIKARRFRDWRARAVEGVLISQVARNGAKKKIDEAANSILVGWILTKNLSKLRVTREEGADFLEANMNIRVTAQTVGRYFRNNGFSYRRAKMQSGKVDHLVDLMSLYRAFLSELPRAVKNGKEKIGSMDATYTSHRTNNLQTYFPIGASQPSVKLELSRFTNCIMTLVYSDGAQSPCHLFTYNRDFLGLASKGKTAAENTNTLQGKLKKWGIEANRIHVLDQPKGGNKTYVGEKPEYVAATLNGYEKYCEYLHTDGGTGFKDGEHDVVEESDFTRIISPSPIHQYVSANDNQLHGVAKSRWRKSRKSFADDVDASCELMFHLDNVKSTTIKKWFDKNMFLDGRAQSDAEIRKVIGSGRARRPVFYAAALSAYRKFVAMPVLKEHELCRVIQSALDGKFWN